jgi:predicted dehydrogenase
MEKLRFGVIGAGGIVAKMHLPELAEEAGRAQVTLISGRKESRLKLLCGQYDIARYTHDYEDVISDPEVDAIIVATPHPQHVSWGIKAIEAGKHVFMQKPLCADMNEANAFVAAAEETDRTVFVLPHFPDPVHAVWRGIQDGTIGRVSGARARTSHGGPEVYYREVREIFHEDEEPGAEENLWFFDAKQASAGALFDMGVYAVSHLIAMLGSVKSVSAVVNTFDKPTTLEDNAVLLLQMESGALAAAETSWCDAARTWQMSVHGTRGKYDLPGYGIAPHLFTPLSYDSDHAPIEEKTLEVPDVVGSAHKHFLDCVQQGIQPPLSNARAARHVTEVLLAATEASRSGSAVAIESSAV